MKKNDLPNGWRVVELGNVIIINESNYNIKDGWKFINYLDTGNITENNISNIQLLNTKTDKIPSRAKRKIQVGDIVYSTVRPNQRHYGVIKKNYDNLLVSTGFATIRAIDKMAYTPFIYWFLTQNKVVSYLQTIGEHSTSTYPAIKSTDVEKLKINLPPLPEQKAIAHILGKLDDKIALNRQINQTLETMASTLFKSWFVNFDPVIDNALKAGNPIPDFLKTQAEKRKTTKSTRPKTTQNLFLNRFVFNDKLKKWIPEGWEISVINKIGKVICGKTPSKSKKEYYGGNTLFVKIPNMHNEVYVLETNEYLTELGSKSQLNKSIPRGSIAVSCIATVGKVVLIDKESHTNQQINSIIPNQGYYQYYLYFLMLSLNGHFHSLASSGSATLNMNTSTFSDIKITMPNNHILKTYDKQVKSNFETILFNQKQTQTLTKLRDTLLPKLISGKIRIFAKN